MAYPPPTGASPTPSPTPRPVTPGYTSPADYMDATIEILQEEDQNEMVAISDIVKEYQRIAGVMRDAET